MPETYVVTGAAGFIGSNFVRLVRARKETRIVALDKLTYAGNPANLALFEGDPSFEFFKGDIADRALVGKILADYRPAAVINFAAESHVDRSIDSPADFLRTNVTGTFNLLECARDYCHAGAAPDGFRFLQVSTDEVYGSLDQGGFFNEETPYAPNSPYSASKAAADHFTRAYFSTYGLPVLITNCSNNYGPFQFPEKLIPLMVLKALDAQPLPIYGDGSNIRDWIYVEDHCRGVLTALERGVPGRKYNFGGDSERSNLEVVQELCVVLDELAPASRNPAMKKKNLKSYLELKSFVQDRPGHDFRYAIDSTRAKNELEWTPGHTFRLGLRKTVAWYLEHLDWCRDIQSGNYRLERLGLAAEKE